ncbi:Hypothetical Protein FCC1311_053952 [Hondaea fermentalgiana]|uniref:Uncharacterized protein n=1 Tax=Hondaea fermentalgiana TaxID=2315210 RepID=A0A2R5GKM5_9STRA|nr:Hypothetical Protein FCC1311_053952 [Hondaea fermentalgiana]|eukprot:GBG29173.1 Hypothetical Protein FCC1311_053952 [Hondaea fermentalgiana]
MDEFIAEKKRILREHNVALHPVDANVLPAMQEDAKPKKQARNPKSRSSRRKSISFDDMLDLFDDEDAENMPQTTSSARVMWSADGVSTSNTDAAGQQ